MSYISAVTQFPTLQIQSHDPHLVPLLRNHHRPDNDDPQHYCPEITPQGLLCHSHGSVRVCLLHLCLLGFGGIWHPTLFCQQPEAKQGQRQKEEKPCMYQFPL